MTETKRSFTICLTTETKSPLSAHQSLSAIEGNHCHHHDNGYRHPLGIYNVSISRVCERLIAFLRNLESYIQQVTFSNHCKNYDTIERALIESIELTVYAAAEHVDDIKAIAKGFFQDEQTFRRCEAASHFLKEINRHRTFVSASANAIKHQQAHIRLCMQEFSHAGFDGILHGYYIEGVKNGVVCPSPVFHESRKIFSITTLAWEILLFLYLCSESLSLFLHSLFSYAPSSQEVGSCPLVSEAVIAAARLPLYSFDEEHPFSRCTFSLVSDESITRKLNSGLYGSLSRPWALSSDARFGSFSVGFMGDAVSTAFELPLSSNVSLLHWK